MRLSGGDLGLSRLTVGLLITMGLVMFAAWPAAASSPGQATPVQPSGAVIGSTLTFTWAKASFNPSWYVIEVDDATLTAKFFAWYTAEQVGCAGIEDNCTVTVTLGGLAPGVATWWVRSWNSEGFGPWSVGMDFTVSAPTPAWAATLRVGWRFVRVMGGAAVLDNETGLVWEQSPSLTDVGVWAGVFDFCFQRITGGRRGWRVPTAEQLLSLQNPATHTLPAGHPFSANSTGVFWTATTSAADPAWAAAIGFVGDPSNSYIVRQKSTNSSFQGWCVRGGQGFDGR
jgi:hypothetical protein